MRKVFAVILLVGLIGCANNPISDKLDEAVAAIRSLF